MVCASSPTSSSTESSSETAVESPSDASALYLPLDCLSPKPCVTRLASDWGTEETRSDKYWFEDGTAVFKTEDTLYKVYKGTFTRQSSFLASKITAVFESPPVCSLIRSSKGKLPKAKYETVQPDPPRLVGLGSEGQPVLLDVPKSNFELLLAYMFPDDYEKQYSFSSHEWLTIANAAKQLELKAVVAVTTSKICQTASALELIDIGRKHDNRACYLEGFRRLCTRESPLTVDEGLKLGVECVVAISQAREKLAKGTKWSEIEDLVRFRDGIEAKAQDEMLKAMEDTVATAEKRATEAEARALAMAQVRLEARNNVAEEAIEYAPSEAEEPAIEIYPAVVDAVEINSSRASPVPNEESELVEAVSSQSELRQHNKPESTWQNGPARGIESDGLFGSGNGVNGFGFGAAHKKAGQGWFDF